MFVRHLLNAETLFMSLLRYAIKEVNDLVLSLLMGRIASKLISSKLKSILEIGFDEINLEMIPPYVWIYQYSIGFILLWLWNNWEKSYWWWRLYHITRSSKEDRNCYQGCVPGWWSEGIGNSRWHNCSNSLL